MTEDRERDAQGLLFVPIDWREYDWYTGLWDISKDYWSSSASRETMCLEAWTVGTNDWRSL